MKCTRIHALKAPFLLEALGVLMTLPRCAISRCHPHHSAKRSQQSMSASEKLANMSPNDSRLGFEDCSPISKYIYSIYIEEYLLSCSSTCIASGSTGILWAIDSNRASTCYRLTSGGPRSEMITWQLATASRPVPLTSPDSFTNPVPLEMSLPCLIW